MRSRSFLTRYLIAISLAFFVILYLVLFSRQQSTSSSFSEDYLNAPPRLGSSSSSSSIVNNNNVNANANANANITDLERIKPKLLSLEDRSKHHLFVHIGKAGGSSIQVMVKKSRNMCEKLSTTSTTSTSTTISTDEEGKNKQENEKTTLLVKTQVCALAKIPDGRVHLKERLHPKKYYAQYQQFFVNVRDPIDRLVSWYNYELKSYRKEPRWSSANQTGQASDNFRRLSQTCFPGENGFAAMVNGGLLSSTTTSTMSSNEDNNKEKDDDDDDDDSCNELARLCLRGDIMCFGHNYYNYEVYLEELLLRKGFSGNSSSPSTSKETIRIDVIRSEHSMDDFNRTVGLWTSKTTKELEEFAGVTSFVQSLYSRVRATANYDSKQNNKDKDKHTTTTTTEEVLSPEARTALCKHICTELIIYKLALKAADNLDSLDILDSYDALDEHCGFRVDEVCGTAWTYRDIKTKKKVFDAPW